MTQQPLRFLLLMGLILVAAAAEPKPPIAPATIPDDVVYGKSEPRIHGLVFSIVVNDLRTPQRSGATKAPTPNATFTVLSVTSAEMTSPGKLKAFSQWTLTEYGWTYHPGPSTSFWRLRITGSSVEQVAKGPARSLTCEATLDYPVWDRQATVRVFGSCTQVPSEEENKNKKTAIFINFEGTRPFGAVGP
jgi:hypothetical protein